MITVRPLVSGSGVVTLVLADGEVVTLTNSALEFSVTSADEVGLRDLTSLRQLVAPDTPLAQWQNNANQAYTSASAMIGLITAAIVPAGGGGGGGGTTDITARNAAAAAQTSADAAQADADTAQTDADAAQADADTAQAAADAARMAGFPLWDAAVASEVGAGRRLAAAGGEPDRYYVCLEANTGRSPALIGDVVSSNSANDPYANQYWRSLLPNIYQWRTGHRIRRGASFRYQGQPYIAKQDITVSNGSTAPTSAQATREATLEDVASDTQRVPSPSGVVVGWVLSVVAGAQRGWRAILEVPSGGTVGQVLRRIGNSYGWATLFGVPAGGTSGQFLRKSSNTDGATEWVNAPSGGGGGGTPTSGGILERTNSGVSYTLEANFADFHFIYFRFQVGSVNDIYTRVFESDVFSNSFTAREVLYNERNNADDLVDLAYVSSTRVLTLSAGTGVKSILKATYFNVGQQGATGVGENGNSNYLLFANGTSATVAPTGAPAASALSVNDQGVLLGFGTTYLTAPEAVPAGSHQWIIYVFRTPSGTITRSNPIRVTGLPGTPGTAGTNGRNGAGEYILQAASTSATEAPRPPLASALRVTDDGALQGFESLSYSLITPTVAAGSFLWQVRVFRAQDGRLTVFTPVRITGRDGTGTGTSTGISGSTLLSGNPLGTDHLGIARGTDDRKTLVSTFLSAFSLDGMAAVRGMVKTAFDFVQASGGFVRKLATDLILTTTTSTATYGRPSISPFSAQYDVGGKAFDGENRRSGGVSGNPYASLDADDRVEAVKVVPSWSTTHAFYYPTGANPLLPAAYSNIRSFLRGRLGWRNVTGQTFFTNTEFRFWGQLFYGLTAPLTRGQSSTVLGWVGREPLLEVKNTSDGSLGLGVNVRRDGSGTVRTVVSAPLPLRRSDGEGETFHWAPIGISRTANDNENAVLILPASQVAGVVVSIPLERRDNDRIVGGTATLTLSIPNPHNAVAAQTLSYTWNLPGGLTAGLTVTASYNPTDRSVNLQASIPEGSIHYYGRANIPQADRTVVTPTTYAYEVAAANSNDTEIRNIQWALDPLDASADPLLRLLLRVDGGAIQSHDINARATTVVSAAGLDMGQDAAANKPITWIFGGFINKYDGNYGMQASDLAYAYQHRFQDLGALVHTAGASIETANFNVNALQVRGTDIRTYVHFDQLAKDGPFLQYRNAAAQNVSTPATLTPILFANTELENTTLIERLSAAQAGGSVFRVKKAGFFEVICNAEVQQDYAIFLARRGGASGDFTVISPGYSSSRDGNNTAAGTPGYQDVSFRVLEELVSFAENEEFVIYIRYTVSSQPIVIQNRLAVLKLRWRGLASAG